ncbi:hypothetical protein EUX98_g5547 [Antrodiella citrinella]|uniref:Cytochrome P450 n=1 Tax=Antrodiella citrinella TaxID=2447956 RepID=A0A4S4MRB3_9APHY|nr:hypothetical protein EUX98_g5547 [Antrodiella citrinella]
MPAFSTWLALGVLVFFVRRFVKAYIVLKAMKGLPRRYVLCSPITIAGSIIPVSTRWYPRLIGAWIERSTLYKEFDSEAIVFVPLLWGEVTVHLASPETTKLMLADPNAWPKPEIAVTLNMMGNNVLTAQGEQWRLHRRTVTPAFSTETHIDVWEVTRSLYYQMLDTEEWRSGDHHYFPSVAKYTTRLALLVIAACGFNMRLQWNEEGSSDGLASPIDSAVVTVSSTILERLNFSEWIFRLPFEGVRKIDTAWHDLQFWLKREVRNKKNELISVMKMSGDSKGEHERNVFGRLIAASIENGQFSDDDVVGNLFIFFFAGHETTAWTLANALALLALYPDEQEKIYEHIVSVIGDREPAHTDYNDLAPVLNCFYEALRLFPTVHIMLRTPSEDIVISDPNFIPSGEDVLIPKGVVVAIDLIGESRNPRIFPDPEKFDPARWSSASEAGKTVMEHFFGFSTGPRVCVGKRFATFEAVCFITLVLRDWKVGIKLNEGETPAEWRARIMDPTLLATMRMKGDVPLLFTRRSSKA